jgi:hypothetical protein
MMKGVAMHSPQKIHCRFGLPLACVLGFVIVASEPVHAIPMAGNYAFTSGFTGIFTSDGSKLTAWDFRDPSNYHWSDRITVDRNLDILVNANDANGFSADRLNSHLFNRVDLEYSHTNPSAFRYSFFNFEAPPGSTNGSGIGTFHIASSVPIPSTFLPFVAGLLILVGFHWRQQRVRKSQTE